MFKLNEYVNYYDYCSTLNPNHFVESTKKRQAKVVCTIGPESRPVEMLEKLMENGMNIARLMLGKGNYDYDRDTIKNIRTAAANHGEKLGREFPFAIAVDLLGSEVQIGLIECGLPNVLLKPDYIVEVTTDERFRERCNAEHIFVDYPTMPKVLKVGDEIYLSHGIIAMEVLEVKDISVICKVNKGGTIAARDQVNFPAVVVDLPELTERDIKDIAFCAEAGVDIIIVSHTRFTGTIVKVKNMLGSERKNIAVLAKIHNFEGIQIFEELLEVADGFCLARNDLGVNVSIQKLTYFQKQLTAKSNRAGKPVCVTGCVLNSMIRRLNPRRDEVTDVANCILDGIDCFILYKQTVTGKYPIETVQDLDKIIKAAERHIWRTRIFSDFCKVKLPPVTGGDGMAITAVDCVHRIKAAAILVVTRSGRSAKMIAKYQPDCPILAICRSMQKAKHMLLYKCIEPIIPPPPNTRLWLKDLENQLQYAIDVGLRENFFPAEKPVVILTPSKPGAGYSDSMRIFNVKQNYTTILY